MPWSRSLKPPLDLRDGRRLETLEDAAQLLFSLPPDHQRRPTWVYAAELMKDAAEGKRAALGEVDLQLYRALQQSRLI